MNTEIEDKEIPAQGQSAFRDNFKPALIFIGALSILLTKEYVSAKMLMGLVMLDYFTTDFIKRLPMPVCFIIFMILTALAVT